MKKIDKKVWNILLTTGVFLLIVFLPQIDSLVCHLKYIHKPTMVKKENDTGIHYNLSIQDKLEIISGEQTDVVMQINGKDSFDEACHDTELLEHLQTELQIMEDKHLIPIIQEKNNLKEHLKQANYYNISNKTGSILSVPIWVLEFSGENDCSYLFIVDAETYKIYAYHIRVCIQEMEQFWNTCLNEPKMRETTEEYIFLENMLNKMADYYEADSGYNSYIYDLGFHCNLDYKDDFKGISVEFEYYVTSFDEFQGHTEITMGVLNQMSLLEDRDENHVNVKKDTKY